MKISRRTFLQATGATAAGAALAGSGRYLFELPVASAAVETHVHNVCAACSGGCANIVKIVDGVATELSGNPFDQAGRGKLCVKGHSGLNGWYNSPGRLTKPMKRTNPKKGPDEDPGFVPISWTEALTLMADKMKEAIATAGPESIAFVMRPSPDLVKRFTNALGTPNLITHTTTCYSPEEIVWSATVRDADTKSAYKRYVVDVDYSLAGQTVTALVSGAMAGKSVVASYVSGGQRHTEARVLGSVLPVAWDLEALPDDGTLRLCSAPSGLKGRNWTRDIARSSYILSFGFDMPGKAKNMMAQDFLYAVNNGTKAVVFDPRFSETAAVAVAAGGEWHPIKPGTDLAVLLAMTKYIIDHDLWNDPFVVEGTTGFAQFKEHFTTGVGKGYTAAWAEGISGVPAAVIERIAREFANDGQYTGAGVHTPDWVPCIFTHKRDAAGPNYAAGWRVSQAITAIDTLVGSIDRLGGEVVEKKHPVAGIDYACPAPPYPPRRLQRLDGAEKFPLSNAFTKGAYQHLFKAIVDEDPYPIKFLFLRKYNLLSIPGGQAEQMEAINKVFIAVADIQASETVWMADVVLPEVSFLEGRNLNQRSYFALWPQTAAQLPAPKISGEAKGFRAILPELAKAFGDWKNAAGYTVQDYFRMNPGGTFDPAAPLLESKAYDDHLLKKLGKDLGDAALESGGWDYLASLPEGLYPAPGAPVTVPVDPKSFQPSYGTAAKRIALYSTVFEDFGADPLPVWQPPFRAAAGDYTLQLIITRPGQHIHSTTQDFAYNHEMYPKNCVWVNPADAAGIATGDLVQVENQFGRSIRLEAWVTPRIMPGVLCVPHGFGHYSKLLKIALAKGSDGGGTSELIEPLTVAEAVANGDPSQGSQMQDVYVKVSKV